MSYFFAFVQADKLGGTNTIPPKNNNKIKNSHSQQTNTQHGFFYIDIKVILTK